MAFCPNCGAQVEDGKPFCDKCGAPIQAQAQQPVYAVPIAVSQSDHTAEFDPQDISDNKVFAMVSYLLGVVGIIIALLAAQKSDYAMFHVRQALKLSICSFILIIIAIIPFLGWLVAGVGAIIIFVLQIIMFFNVCKGKAVEVPLVGDFKFLK